MTQSRFFHLAGCFEGLVLAFGLVGIDPEMRYCTGLSVLFLVVALLCHIVSHLLPDDGMWDGP